MKTIFNILISLICIWAAVSCSGNGTQSGEGGDSVEVSPSEINAPCTLNTQTVGISSDGSWTISIVDESGESVSWAEADKTSGKGNAEIHVRIYVNRYKGSRTAIMNVSTTKGASASVRIMQEGDSESGADFSSIDVRVGSYNLRMSTLDQSDANNKWSVRKDRAMRSIRENNFDFFGVQECDVLIQSDLKKEVGDIYTCKFFSPYSQTGEGDKAQGLLYKTSKFTLSDWHYFWPSNDPDRMSTNDTGSSGNFSRGGCCGVLTHKDTGVKIFIMVTHAFLNNSSNNEWAYVYADMEKRFNTHGYPSIFVGDMNSKPNDPPSETHRRHWKDTYMELPASEIEGPAGTYNGFDVNRNMATASRIDYIYFRGGAQPKHYVCNQTKYDGFWASDHLPIYAEMTIQSTPE